MDYRDFSKTKNNLNNNILNNTNLYQNMDENQQLQYQLDLLKEKLKIKEKEMESIIYNQKEEYEKNTKEKDEEVNGLVEHLLVENQELKRLILDNEIEIEQLKEIISEYKKNSDNYYADENFNFSNFNNNNISNINKTNNFTKKNPNTLLNISGLQDTQFLNSIRLLKNNNESNQKDIQDKYNNLTQNLIYENKVAMENFKRINIDNKNRILNSREINEGNNNVNNNISFKIIEDQINSYENKMKILFEEMKNKDKYISLIEHKFEMLNEENSYVRNKISEEKKFLLMKINEIKKEHENTHLQVIKKMEQDLNEKKTNLQFKVDESLKVNEEVIKNIVKEKEKFFEENKNLKNKIDCLNSEIEEIIELKKKSEDNINKKEEEMKIILENKEIWSEENTTFNIEKNLLIKTNEEMRKKITEFTIKISSLEHLLQHHDNNQDDRHKDTELTLRDYDNKYKNQIEKLNLQIVDLERKLRQYSYDFEGEDNKILMLEKKIKDDEVAYLTSILEYDKLKVDCNEAKVSVKLLTQTLEENSKNYEKLKSLNNILDLENIKKDQIIKNLNEKLAVLESEKISNENEIERLVKIKNEVIVENDEIKKSRLFITTQLDTVKMSNNIEIQRLKSQIYELEKMTKKIHLVQLLENNIITLKKGIADTKKLIQNIYNKFIKISENDTFLQNSIDINQLEETNMLSEIEANLDKFILSKKNDLNIQSNSSVNTKNIFNKNKLDKDPKTYIADLETQVNSLKKKLFLLDNRNNNLITDNPNFNKLSNNENKSSLYETILIYIKNINIQHLLEIYNLHIKKEEEINKIFISNKIPSANEFSIKLKNLSEKLFHLTKHCEISFKDYESRSKAYISVEEYERKILDYKNFMESNLNDFLNLMVGNMINNNDFVIFKLHNNDYNQALENLSGNLENYNKINFEVIENYKKSYFNIQSAVEIIQNQAKIEYDNLKNIINDENLKFL